MYSCQNPLFYNSYEHCSPYHERLPNELPEVASINYGAPTFNHNVAEVPSVVLPSDKAQQRPKEDKKAGRLVVDTSAFSVEERLVAAVWVHERKRTKTSMSQIKTDFLQRFGREPPAKNTLLVWERKLFSSGSIHDAPRPGRPVSRRSKVEAVSQSLHSAPTLSVRARASALRVPRTTLRTILQRDLTHVTHVKRTPKRTSKKSNPPPPGGPPYLYHGYS